LPFYQPIGVDSNLILLSLRRKPELRSRDLIRNAGNREHKKAELQTTKETGELTFRARDTSSTGL